MKFILATMMCLLLPGLASASDGGNGRAAPRTGVTPATQGADIGPGRAVDISTPRWMRGIERANDRMMVLSGAGSYAGASRAEHRRAMCLMRHRAYCEN